MLFFLHFTFWDLQMLLFLFCPYNVSSCFVEENKRVVLDITSLRWHNKHKNFQDFFFKHFFFAPSSPKVCKTFLSKVLNFCTSCKLQCYLCNSSTQMFPACSMSLQVFMSSRQKEDNICMNLIANAIILLDQKCSVLTSNEGICQRKSIAFRALEILKCH